MKLPPNFSWQKYDDDKLTREQQFQYQLQRMYIEIANAINTNVNDESFWLEERMTAFTWVDSKPIWTKTLATVAWIGAGTSNIIPLNIQGNFTIVYMSGTLSDGTLSSSNTLSLPHLDPAYGPGSIGYVRNGTNIVISTSGTDYSAFSGFVTVYFTKG